MSFVQPVTNQNGAVATPGVQSAAAKNRIMELEAEVMQLKEQLGKAKSLNDAMWDSVVQQLVNREGRSEAEKGEEGNNPRRRKRSRGA